MPYTSEPFLAKKTNFIHVQVEKYTTEDKMKKFCNMKLITDQIGGQGPILTEFDHKPLFMTIFKNLGSFSPVFRQLNIAGNQLFLK